MCYFPEIKALESFIKKHSVSMVLPEDDPLVFDLIPVFLQFHKERYLCYIQDEYDDLTLNDPRIPVVLALREFEIIEESSDYLHWCTMTGISAGSEILRNYYQDTIRLLPVLRSKFKQMEITSFISDLDFQLNAGAMQYLRDR